MTRFLITGALVIAGAFGLAGKADAQYVYSYNSYLPGAGIAVGSTTYATPFGAKSVNSYYSPYTGVGVRQSYYGDVFGNQAARVSGYNPWANLGYRTGYSYAPYAPYARGYGYYYRR